MKLIFASDIHGSLFFCEKLIDQYEKEQPDKLILLGDLLYHGPKNNLTQDYNTMQVAKLLNSIKSPPIYYLPIGFLFLTFFINLLFEYKTLN